MKIILNITIWKRYLLIIGADLKAVYQNFLTFQFPCFETETLDDFRTLILPRFKAYLFVSETPLETKTYFYEFLLSLPYPHGGGGVVVLILKQLYPIYNTH